MKSILTIFFFYITTVCVVAQQNDCSFYVESDQTRKKVRHSSYLLNFAVTENIEVTLKINDKGSRGTIELMFDFEDISGLPAELGSTLLIKFIDGTSYSMIARTKKVSSAIIYFTLVEKGSNSNKDYDFITDKLSKVDIAALEITADYRRREIPIPETKATIIKKTIRCLMGTD